MAQKNITLGLVAHVDSGKTTLTEAMLVGAGALRQAGRVDHGDAFLDTHALERSRGITIFAKEARLTLPHTALTLLDTPGHADFGAEMERTLAVLDYAVLIISGTDPHRNAVAPAGTVPHPHFYFCEQDGSAGR